MSEYDEYAEWYNEYAKEKTEYAEEKAAELIARRNAIVKAGADPDTRYVNKIEERASNWLTRAKHG